MRISVRIAQVWRFLGDFGFFIGFAALLLLGALSQVAFASEVPIADEPQLEATPLQISDRGRSGRRSALSTYIELDFARDHALQWGKDRGANGNASEHPRKRLNEKYGNLYARLKLSQSLCLSIQPRLSAEGHLSLISFMPWAMAASPASFYHPVDVSFGQPIGTECARADFASISDLGVDEGGDQLLLRMGW